MVEAEESMRGTREELEQRLMDFKDTLLKVIATIFAAAVGVAYFVQSPSSAFNALILLGSSLVIVAVLYLLEILDCHLENRKRMVQEDSPN
jgi:hypothetical protein